jgi:hypothetical protein
MGLILLIEFNPILLTLSSCNVSSFCQFDGPDYNQLTGAIPSELGELTSLQQLKLCK